MTVAIASISTNVLTSYCNVCSLCRMSKDSNLALYKKRRLLIGQSSSNFYSYSIHKYKDNTHDRTLHTTLKILTIVLNGLHKKLVKRTNIVLPNNITIQSDTIKKAANLVEGVQLSINSVCLIIKTKIGWNKNICNE